MSNVNQPELTLELDENPEIRSFVYQQILEFEPYVTPQTIVAVIAKDPLKMRSKLLAEGQEISKQELSKMYRIAISLKEDGSQIQEEALHSDIFEAIKLAKQKLIQKLEAIQEHVLSQSDRIEQINQALGNNSQIH
jgi:ribosome-associated translation inhibitor RaiA